MRANETFLCRFTNENVRIVVLQGGHNGNLHGRNPMEKRGREPAELKGGEEEEEKEIQGQMNM